jgi:hypothetical protein
MRKPIALALVVASLATFGCTRAFYRKQADGDAYRLVEETACRTEDGPAPFTIELNPMSRMFDPSDPDCPAMPPDDPAAHDYMHCVDGKKGWRGWHGNGDIPFVENPYWHQFLPLDDDQTLSLTAERAVQLSLLHSRDYQEQLETLYLDALDVSAERFEFDTQFFGGYASSFSHDGPARDAASGSQSLFTNTTFPGGTDLQMRKYYATGAELVVGLANSLVWQFSGPDEHTALTIADFAFVQPLLRQGGRARVLEALTLAQRDLLANVRQFERFRRGFNLAIMTGIDSLATLRRTGGFLGISSGPTAGRAGGFLGLLQDEQTIRNQEANIAALKSSLAQLEAFFEAGRIDFFQVELTRQELFRSQSQLLNRKTDYEDALDQFKISMGLPPQLKVRVHDPMLQSFNLVDVTLVDLRNRLTRQQKQVGDLVVGLLPADELDADDKAAANEDELPIDCGKLGENAAAVKAELERIENEIGANIAPVDPAPVIHTTTWDAATVARLKTLRNELNEVEVIRRQVAEEGVARACVDIRRLHAVLNDRRDELIRIEEKFRKWIATDPEAMREVERAGLESDLVDVKRIERLPAQLYKALVRALARLEQNRERLVAFQQHIDQLLDAGEAADGTLNAERVYALTEKLLREQWQTEHPDTPLPGNMPTGAHSLHVWLRTSLRDPMPSELIVLSANLLEVTLIQAQARTESIALKPVDLTPVDALEVARIHRRDWKNARASLVDAWRNIEFVADDLQSELDIEFSGDIRNTGDNPIRLRGTTGRLRASLEFDAPLTRLSERNDYRAALIDYQQARRDYYAFEDQVARNLRLLIRTIERNQVNFELQRASVRVAISQVELSQLRLQEPPKPNQTQTFGATTARDLVDSLSRLLNVQNDFLSVWVEYEVARRTLDFNLGTMQLDGEGRWIDPGAIDANRFGPRVDCPIEELPPGLPLEIEQVLPDEIVPLPAPAPPDPPEILEITHAAPISAK